MTDEETRSVSDERARTISPALVILLVVAALFAGVLFAKARSNTAVAPSTAVVGGATQAPAGATITSVRNDALADYEAAMKTGKPIYVLFHSLS